MDYYERNLVNHRLGTIEPETGRTTYFLSLAPGAWKTLATDDDTFWCCTGTAVEDFSKLGDSIYAHDARGVYVNQFIASTLDWTERGLRIHQTTDFPRKGSIALTIAAAPGGEWPIHVRIPGWTTDSARVLVNGRPVEAVADSGSYLRISRRWKAGDRIMLDLPVPLHTESLPDAPHIQALMAGPVVLAAQQPRGDIPAALAHDKGPATDKLPLAPIALAKDGRPLDQRVRPTGRAPHGHEAATANGGMVTFKPLYDSWDRFSVYLDTSA
jgi:DUF1680 family protein